MEKELKNAAAQAGAHDNAVSLAAGQIENLLLQQIEGNLIYPHVVGGSVGLPSIWVLAAVTIGGNLMGIVGMLVFIPLLSVLYTIFREFVYLRLKNLGKYLLSLF